MTNPSQMSSLPKGFPPQRAPASAPAGRINTVHGAAPRTCYRGSPGNHLRCLLAQPLQPEQSFGTEQTKYRAPAGLTGVERRVAPPCEVVSKCLSWYRKRPGPSHARSLRCQPMTHCVGDRLGAVTQAGLIKMLFTCVFTVVSLITSWSAISRLLRP